MIEESQRLYEESCDIRNLINVTLNQKILLSAILSKQQKALFKSHRLRVIKAPAPSEDTSIDSASLIINQHEKVLDEFDADCYFKSELKETISGAEGISFTTQSRLDRNLLLGTFDQPKEKKAVTTLPLSRQLPRRNQIAAHSDISHTDSNSRP